jgi:glycosyltransferase involved in cell wall biosynthesis
VKPSLTIEMALPTLFPGGMEVVTMRLAMRLAEKGHRVGVTCVIDEGPLADDLRASGIRVARVPAPGLRTNVLPLDLARWLRRVRPDVVHIHSGVWLKAARAARLARIRRVVFTEHGALDVEPWYASFIKRSAARLTDVVVSVSAPLAEVLVDTHGVPRAKIRVVPNGVDTERFRPGPAGPVLQQLGVGDGPTIGHVARLVPVKNQDLLLHAFAEVRRRVPNAQLVIVGDGPERERLLQLIDELGLRGAAHLPGEHRDVASLLRAFSVFALPSKAEGTSMSVLEAMASGVPVVASAVGGTPALLDDGQCGVLIPPNDRSALADALVALLGDPDRRSRLAAAARARAVNAYGEARVVEQYEALYAGIADRSAAPMATDVTACVG